jgi:hypothetical protein
MRDIYDPPPAPVAWNPPKADPLVWKGGDVAFLATFILLLAFVTGVAWAIEPTVAILVTLGGTLVILESWFTALGFLHRHRLGSLRARWVIFLAALIPWLVGLGVAATLMLGLFLASDWVGS